MCNYTDVMSESGTVYGLSVDLCHHVSSCFSFWGKDKPIRLSCSYNYFCSSPFSMPSLSVMLSVSAQAWVSIPRGHDAAMPISGDCRWEIGNYLRFNTIFQIKTEELNEILQCYLSGRIGHSSVLPWWTDNTTHLLFYRPHATDCISQHVCTICRCHSALWVVYVILSFSSSIKIVYIAV